MVFDYRPLKSEPYRCRLVAGGDRLSFDHDASSPATSILETKLLLNSTISDAQAGARFLSTDLKDFFLASPMANPEYMKRQLVKFLTPAGYIPIDTSMGMWKHKENKTLFCIDLALR